MADEDEEEDDDDDDDDVLSAHQSFTIVMSQNLRDDLPFLVSDRDQVTVVRRMIK